MRHEDSNFCAVCGHAFAAAEAPKPEEAPAPKEEPKPEAAPSEEPNQEDTEE